MTRGAADRYLSANWFGASAVDAMVEFPITAYDQTKKRTLMGSPSIVLKKHARGEYEIGIQTDDGAVVARVSIWDGASIDRRSDGEREKAAMEKAGRLAEAFSAAMKP